MSLGEENEKLKLQVDAAKNEHVQKMMCADRGREVAGISCDLI